MDGWSTLHDTGGRHWSAGRLDEAEKLLRRAQRARPSEPRTRHALGIVLLAQGRYAEGWPLYEARHEIADLGLFKPEMPYREWRGEPLDGKKLLIFPEQGLGDQIMFARFAPYLRDRGAAVTLLCNPLLTRLFDFPGVRVIGASGPVEFPDPDYWVMSGSVAGRLLSTPDDIPAEPYLARRAPGAEAGIGVGVMVAGNPRHANDAIRSLRGADAERLLALPGAVDLSPQATGAGDFAATAEIIAGLSHVVSVDTAVAHLAGAMGKPVSILVPDVMTDWRWLTGRTDSPWYPSATIYRFQPGRAGEAIERVLSDLALAA